MIFLDTNVAASAINRRPPTVRPRLRTAIDSGETLAISSIVLFELSYGVAKSEFRERNAAKLADFVSAFVQILGFEQEDAEQAGDIRARLERSGTPIGSYDILIAAQARRHDALLVTANVREFARVPGLRIEDWTTSS